MRNGKCSILSVLLIFLFLFVAALVLFPPIGMPMEAAAKAKCLMKLKQCAQALKMYADDYDGQLPSSYLVSHAKRWNAADSLTFCARIGAFPPGQAPKQTWAQVLYDHIYAPDVVFCPRDPVDRKNPHAWISYWYKVANDKAWYGVGCKAPRRSMSDYRHQIDQIAFYEHRGWHCRDTASGLKKGIQINAVYIDTHVETILLPDDATTGDPINCAANSDGEPMYYNTKVLKDGAKKQKGAATLTDPATCYDSL